MSLGWTWPTSGTHCGQEVQWRRNTEVPVQFVQDSQLRPQQLIRGTARALVL